MKRQPYRGLCIDTETGGFDEQIHALTSICVGAFTLFPDRAPEVESCHLEIRAHESLVVTEDAARIQGKTVAEMYLPGQIGAYRRSENHQLGELSFWLWNEGLIGLPVWAHNADFDRKFLSAACDRYCPGWGKARPSQLATTSLSVCTLAGRDSRWSCTRYLAEYLVQKGKLELPTKVNSHGEVVGSVSLDPLLERLGIPGRQGTGHDAHEDVRLGVAVLDALLRLDGWWE